MDSFFIIFSGYETTNLWDVWTSDGQVAGYQTQFDVPNSNNLAFVTVRGAGHEVLRTKMRFPFFYFSSFFIGANL